MTIAKISKEVEKKMLKDMSKESIEVEEPKKKGPSQKDIEKAKGKRKAKRRDMHNSGKVKELYARITEIKKEKKVVDGNFEKLKTEFLKFLRNEQSILQESAFFKMHVSLNFDFVEAYESFRKVGMYDGAYDIIKRDFEVVDESEVIEKAEKKTGQDKYRKLLKKTARSAGKIKETEKK